FFSTTRVELERHEPKQVGDCLRFEYRRIDTRFKHARITRIERFADRLVRDARGVEFRDVEMVSQKVTGAGAVGRAGSSRQAHQTRSVVNEVAILRRRCSGAAARLMKSRA